MADTYLSRTQTAGNRRTWTWSAWIKRGDVGTRQNILSAGIDGNDESHFRFDATGYLRFKESTGNAAEFLLDTSALFRDPSAWYHIVLTFDSTQSTSTDRIKIYINGSQITSFSSASYPSLNYETRWNNNSQATYLGLNVPAHTDYFDGYMSEVHFTDGTAYAASTFGETDTTGVWIPKVGPSVTYGTNGYYLKFENSGAMGTDSSGNSNTFSVGGGTVIQVPDTPTNVFPTLNPLVAVSPSPTLSEGNLRSTPSGNGNHTTGANIAMPENSGKWYAETVLTYVSEQSGAFTIQDANNIQASANTYSGQYSVTWQASGTDYFATRQGGSSETNSTSTAISAGDIFQIAYDSTNGKVWFGRNNTWITGNPSTDTTPTYSSITGDKVFTTTGYRVSSGSSYTAQQVNFGQDSSFGGSKTAQNNADGNGKGDFYYAPPTGFLALCTDNLSSALTIPVNKGTDNFNIATYTGTGSSHSITGLGFQPDFNWIKNRSATNSHNLRDSIRGVTKVVASNSTVAEFTNAGYVTSFDSDGFSLADSGGDTNASGNTYVAWNWKAGGATPSNTYAVKVVSDSGNKYRFDDYGTSAITLELQEGGTFTFDQSDNSNSGHPLRFSTTANGTHGGGTEYTTGVTTNGTPGQAGAYTRITVAAGAPTLYYYCTQHSGMGGQANTGSLFGFTNVKGSVQCVTSPNTTAGFSVVNVPTTGSVLTAGHGLSKAPSMIIFKSRDKDDYWPVYHSGIGATKYCILNTTAAAGTASSLFNNTGPTSTVFTIGTENAFNNANEETIAYCFAEIEGYSKMGTYAGNNSDNGTFIYLGFRPSFILMKSYTSTENWLIYDSKRDTHNVTDEALLPNLNSASGGSANAMDFLSNGFKLRTSAGSLNGSGQSYLYMAFAENPFVSSGGTPVTAR